VRVFQNKIGALFQTAGTYTLANILNSAIPFLLLPIFTRYLKPFDYGVVATFQVLISFIAPFIGLSIQGAISVKYYDKSGVDLPKYIANCLIVLLSSSIFTSIVLWCFASNISDFLTFPTEWLWSIIIISIGQFLVQVVLTLWQVQIKPISYGTFQILQTISNISLSLVLIIVVGMNWQGRVIAQVFCDGTFGLIAVIILYKNKFIKMEYDKSYIVSALKFGVPLVPHALAGWVMTAVDRVFINKMVGIADTGVYVVGYQVAMVITVIETSFDNAWVPWLYHNLATGDQQTKLKIVKLSYIFIASILFIAMFLSVTAPWFMKFLVGKEFRGSVKFVFWLALSKGLYSVYFVTACYLFYCKRTVLVAFSTFSSAVIHIIATYYLIKINGAIGAAQGGVISTLTLICMTWYFSNRIYKMPWGLQPNILSEQIAS